MRSADTCSACRRVRSLLFAVVLCSVVGLPGSAAFADLVNGDFSSDFDPLADWTPGGDAKVVGGVAVLGEKDLSLACLEQVFTIPDGTVSLSFEYSPRFDPDGHVQTFNAYLEYPDYSLLLPEDPFFQDDVSLVEPYYNPAFVNRSNLGIQDGWTWYRVTVDLSSITLPPSALIAFDFDTAYVGEVDPAWTYNGRIELDNVSVQVPAPAAVVLFVLGMGTACTMLRRRLGRAE